MPMTSVEVAPANDVVLIKDGKNHGAGPALRVSWVEWQDFLSGSSVEGLTVSHHDRVTGHDGVWVHTRWHLRDRGGEMLHFTDDEWAAFWAGVGDDEIAILNGMLG